MHDSKAASKKPRAGLKPIQRGKKGKIIRHEPSELNPQKQRKLNLKIKYSFLDFCNHFINHLYNTINQNLLPIVPIILIFWYIF